MGSEGRIRMLREKKYTEEVSEPDIPWFSYCQFQSLSVYVALIKAVNLHLNLSFHMGIRKRSLMCCEKD